MTSRNGGPGGFRRELAAEPSDLGELSSDRGRGNVTSADKAVLNVAGLFRE